MKKIYFTPGPSQLYPSVAKHIERALSDDVLSMSHRSITFQEIYEDATNSLKKLLGIPQEYSVFFISSATEGMERVIQNCVAKRSFHYIQGGFAKRFYQTAVDYKKNAEKYEMEQGKGFDFQTIEAPRAAELITITQCETSTGVIVPEHEISNLKKRYPHALIAVDVVSSIPCTNLDYEFTDCVFFSVQKGFGLPAGLGVLVLSPAAMEKSQFVKSKGYSIGSYHSFEELLGYASKHQTPETPNVFALYLLSNVLQDMLDVGIEKIRKQTDAKAQLMYEFFDNHKVYGPFVKNPADRAKTVLVIEVKGGSEELRMRLKKQGIVVGGGYGPFKNQHIRIANFPAHSVQMVKKLLSNL